MSQMDYEPFYEDLVQDNPPLCNVYMRGRHLIAKGMECAEASELADVLNQACDSFGLKREEVAVP